MFWLEEIRDTERLELVFSSVQILATFCSRGKWDSDCLMVDGMVSQFGEQVEELWRGDEGGTGKYPPPSLQVSVVFPENSHHHHKPQPQPGPPPKPMISQREEFVKNFSLFIPGTAGALFARRR